MTKPGLLKIINPVLILVFILQAGTGVFRNMLPYELFSAVHKPAGLGLVVLIFIHLYLNWNWVKSVFFKKAG